MASGLYYKHILTSISDDRKWRLYYKCVIDNASLVAAVEANLRPPFIAIQNVAS